MKCVKKLVIISTGYVRKNKMAKSLAYICVEHPEIKAKVDQLGDLVTFDEVTEIRKMMFSLLDFDYCPTVCCDEGSPTDLDFKANKGIRNGHKYDVVKELKYN